MQDETELRHWRIASLVPSSTSRPRPLPSLALPRGWNRRPAAKWLRSCGISSAARAAQSVRPSVRPPDSHFDFWPLSGAAAAAAAAPQSHRSLAHSLTCNSPPVPSFLPSFLPPVTFLPSFTFARSDNCRLVPVSGVRPGLAAADPSPRRLEDSTDS